MEKCIKMVSKLQAYFKNKLFIHKNYSIVKNINILNNHIDPITLEILYSKGKLLYDINYLYPIFRHGRMNSYIVSSLTMCIKQNINEIFTKSTFLDKEIKNINIMNKKLKLEYVIEENNILKKNKVLKKLDILGTYFPIEEYNKINEIEFKKIYYELKSMWTVFANDNALNEINLFGIKLIWNHNKFYEKELINKMDILLNDNNNTNLNKMISYVIIGSFSYVCPHIKNLYNNIIFN